VFAALSLPQNAAQLRRTGVLQELQHVRGQLNALAPQVNAAAAVHDQLREQVETLQAVISEADDSVFGDFCRRIGVGSIRDYEERQLKVAQAVNEARHRFDTQIARLTTQCVFHLNARVFFRLNRHRVKFEEEQLRTTQARLDDLDNVIRTEGEALVRHEQTKQQIEAEIRDAEASIEESKEDLAKANEDLESRTTEVERAKKGFNKASKAVDQVLKDIATKVCEMTVDAFHEHTHYSPFRTVKSRSSV
jgi:structural maintenance of chromosome 1